MRSCKSFHIPDIEDFKLKLLCWSKKFNTVCYYDSNEQSVKRSDFSYASFDTLAGIGRKSEIRIKNNDSFESLKNFLKEINDWAFGYFSYDLKNEIEDLYSKNPDHIKLPGLYFYQPEFVIIINGNKADFLYIPENEGKPDYLIREIIDYPYNIYKSKYPEITVNERILKSEYLESVNQIKKHIYRGDIYEMNFCQEFYSHCEIDPYSAFINLKKISPAPFSCFCNFNDHFLLCASPERFIKKINQKIISQPIKGTSCRGINKDEDNMLMEILKTNKKERAENIMIVDLVRNDLSKIAMQNSVKVEELCGIYTYEQLHQMISTISANIHHKVHPVDVIKNTFPMGSMTGAPKVRAMQLIEEYESTKRGLYSGTVGYFTPDLDFDFNVVIRSILYNHKNKYLSYMVGGAITANSDPEKEYQECILKGTALNAVLKQKQNIYA